MAGQHSNFLADLPRRVDDVIHRWSEHLPDQLALVDADGSWTYHEFELVIERTKTWLIASGIRPGDRVIIVGENCRAFVALLFALIRMDALPVPLNARLSARELDAIQHNCGSRRVLYTTGVSPHALEHAKRDGAAIHESADLGAIGIGLLTENVHPEAADPDTPNAVAAIVYTSGTTGTPKGVMLTHKNLLFSSSVSAKLRSLAPEDRVLGVLPISHTTGLSVQLLGSLVSGATIYLLPQFDPMKASIAIQKNRVTVLYGVPFIFTQFLEYAKLRKLKNLRFAELRIISCSGSPLLPTVKTAVEELFGLNLQHAYGVTECSPGISATRVDAPRTDTSVGPIYPGVEVKLVGPDHESIADGEVGELWVRGPNVMKGYYHAPEETAKAINSDGWFNTRDLAKMEDGNLFIVGRTKELIIRFGFNVYPGEVEGVFKTHPEVAKAAVIGCSDKETGEQEIVAFIQLVQDSILTTSELKEYAGQRLANYKQPTHIHFVSDMPVTVSGKIMKDQLIKQWHELEMGRRRPGRF